LLERDTERQIKDRDFLEKFLRFFDWVLTLPIIKEEQVSDLDNQI